MDLFFELKRKGFLLEDICKEDLKEFILAEKLTHYKYVAEYEYYFGRWNEEVLQDAFDSKRKMTFFKKVCWNGEKVGFLSYDQKIDKIDNVFIRIMGKAQNKGIGTLFLLFLKQLSVKCNIPVFLAVIKSNPAQNLYKKFGFECYKEQDVFYYFKYKP